MRNPVHLRMFGQAITLIVHATTAVEILSRLHSSQDEEVRDFATLQMRFITIWTFTLQITYACIALLCDGLTLLRVEHKMLTPICRLREFIFSALVWPTSLLVFVMFWPAYLTDPGFVFPPFIDKVLTPTNNHVLHTLILPAVLWELLFLPRSIPGRHQRLRQLLCLELYQGAYLFVMFRSFWERGTFIYPLLTRAHGTPLFPMLIGLSMATLIGCYFVQWPLTRLVWRGDKKTR